MKGRSGENNAERKERLSAGGSLPGKQRRLLRTFALASLASILVILALAGFGLHGIFNRHIIEEAEDDALHLTEVLLQHELERFLQLPLSKTRKETRSLDQGLIERLESLHILKIKIFGADGQVRFSNDLSIIGEYDRNNPELKRALAGERVSSLEHKEEAWDLENEKRYDLDVVETYVPMTAPGGTVEGALEIYLDVTRYTEARKNIMTMSMALLASVLVLVFGSLFAMMRTATHLLYAREEEIQVLSGLLPICSYCKKIRNTRKEWEPLESYISSRSSSNFTHSICPECLHEQCPENGERDGG